MSAPLPALLSRLVLDPNLSKLRYRAAMLLYGAIVAVGSIPGARAEIGDYASGIVLHTLAYAGITFLLFTGTIGSARSRTISSVLTVVAMGAFDELVQSFLPYRSGTVTDWLVDCNAAVLMACLLWAFLPAPAKPH